MTMIWTALGEIVQQIVKQGGQADRENLISHLANGLSSALTANKKELAELKRVVAYMEGSLKRVKTKKEENLIAASIRSHIEKINERAAGLTTAIDTIKRSIVFLKDYSYDVDVQGFMYFTTVVQ